MTTERRHPSHWLRKLALALGAFAILVGGVDVLRRLQLPGLDSKASFLAFAPAAALGDPAVANRLATPAAPAATTTQPISPARLKIASLGVDAPVENVGKKADGAMGTPSTFGSVAWYAPGSKPGGPGNAVFAGHVNNALTTAGVFSHLSQIKEGATIQVLDKDGRSLSYEVTSIEEYPAEAAPADAVFSTEGPSQIILITCDGDWDSVAHSFDKRLVVVARLI
ncbi:MAG TPA: class F sortase [Candidatus Paceibacterota bacterium]|nr:class F sortase [Candidatus Paceibacterota bacterium]